MEGILAHLVTRDVASLLQPTSTKSHDVFIRVDSAQPPAGSQRTPRRVSISLPVGDESLASNDVGDDGTNAELDDTMGSETDNSSSISPRTSRADPLSVAGKAWVTLQCEVLHVILFLFFLTCSYKALHFLTDVFALPLAICPFLAMEMYVSHYLSLHYLHMVQCLSLADPGSELARIDR